MSNLIQEKNKIEENQKLNKDANKFDNKRFGEFNKFKDKWEKYDITQKVAIVLFWLMSPIIFFFLPLSIFEVLAIEWKPEQLFFGVFDRFTYLSNYLGCFVLFLYAIKPNHHWFKANRLLLANASYLLFTFIGYNAILSDGYGDQALEIQKAELGNEKFLAWSDLIENILTHIINPLVCIAFFFFVVWKGKYEINNKVLIPTIKTMIFPTIYVLYIIIVPFTNYEDLEGNIFFNPTQEEIENLELVPFSVYGEETNTNGNPDSWLYIGGFYVAFTSWTIGFHYLMKFVYKKNNKQDLIVAKK